MFDSGSKSKKLLSPFSGNAIRKPLHTGGIENHVADAQII